MIEKTRPIELEEEALAEAVGGADAAQRSRVTSVTVTFDTQTTFNESDPDRPLIVGAAPNAGG